MLSQHFFGTVRLSTVHAAIFTCLQYVQYTIASLVKVNPLGNPHPILVIPKDHPVPRKVESTRLLEEHPFVNQVLVLSDNKNVVDQPLALHGIGRVSSQIFSVQASRISLFRRLLPIKMSLSPLTCSMQDPLLKNWVPVLNL